MNEQTYEQEINLGKLCYRIFRDWRKVFLIALVIALVAGIGSFALKRIKTSNPEYIEKAEESYERELAAYKAQGETLEREIANLEESREKQEEYNANSVLMQINPLREFNASLQLYISTDYQIVPELTYQNIDVSNRIVRSYVTYMVNGDMYQYILAHLSKPMELRYLTEVLTMESDYNNCMITMSVRGVDAAFCEEVLKYAMEGIAAKQSEIAALIGEHELSSVNQAVYEAVNLDLDTWQKSNQQTVSELSIHLQEKAEELTKWNSTPEPEKEYTLTEIIKSAIKTMIIGGLIGAVLAAVYIAFCYIASDKLQEAGDLQARFGLRVIAEIPNVHKKRVWVGIDRLFAKMFGLALQECDKDELLRVAAVSAGAELALQGTDEAKVNLVFTGNVPQEEIDQMLSGMKWENKYSVCSAANFLCDAAAVAQVNAADYVILVEKQEESKCSQIEKELSQLKAWKKNVLGVIVLGVDAIA